MQRLAHLAAVIAKLSRHGNRLRIERIGCLVWHQAQVQCHDRTSEQMRKLGDRLHFGQSLAAWPWREEPDSPGNRWNIGVAFAFKTAEDSRKSDLSQSQSAE